MVSSHPTTGKLLESSEVTLLLSPTFTSGNTVSAQVNVSMVTIIIVLWNLLLKSHTSVQQEITY